MLFRAISLSAMAFLIFGCTSLATYAPQDYAGPWATIVIPTNAGTIKIASVESCNRDETANWNKIFKDSFPYLNKTMIVEVPAKGPLAIMVDWNTNVKGGIASYGTGAFMITSETVCKTIGVMVPSEGNTYLYRALLDGNQCRAELSQVVLKGDARDSIKSATTYDQIVASYVSEPMPVKLIQCR